MHGWFRGSGEVVQRGEVAYGCLKEMESRGTKNKITKKTWSIQKLGR